MRTVCAWCLILITAGPACPVSHGICPACATKFLADVVAGR
jgi:hypothetical protein